MRVCVWGKFEYENTFDLNDCHIPFSIDKYIFSRVFECRHIVAK